jgi:hypothetical protein
MNCIASATAIAAQENLIAMAPTALDRLRQGHDFFPFMRI